MITQFLLFKYIERRGARGWRGILENARHMMGIFSKILICVLGKLSKGHCLAVYSMSRSIHTMYKKSGPLFTGQYLKQVNFLLMWYVGGDRDSIPKHKVRVSTTRSGIPRIIPTQYRKMIRDGNNPLVVKIIVSVCTLSRLIIAVPKGGLRFNPTTILDKTFDINESTSEVCNAIWRCMPMLLSLYTPKLSSIPLKLGFNFKPMFSSGPATYLNPIKDSMVEDLGRVKDFSLTIYHTLPLDALNLLHWLTQDFLKQIGSFLFMDREYRFSASEPEVICGSKEGEEGFLDLLTKLGRIGTKSWKPLWRHSLELGRFGRKLEGSGKVRIFAIANPILQTLLRPLHNWVMKLLSTIPMDGTYDQHAPLNRLKGKRELFSFDLKAATDLLPAALSTAVIFGIFGKDFSMCWADIMQSILFRGPDRDPKGKLRLFRFTRGQPLGLYSSWPVFTLTHHVMVWICAWELYPNKVFKDYAILGDDIVIADRGVAMLYEALMEDCQAIISREKSLTSSRGSCEFAKRFIVNNHLKSRMDLSPLSIPLLRMTYGYVSPFVFKHLGCSVRSTFRLRGGGFRVFSRVQGDSVSFRKLSLRWKRHWIVLHAPSGIRPLPINILLTFPERGVLTCYELGMVRFFLLEQVCPKDLHEDSFSTLYKFWKEDDSGMVEVFLRTYMELHLSYLRWFANIIFDYTCLLDVILSPPVSPRKLDRPREDLNLRYGLLFKAWDYLRTHEAPLALCVGSGKVNRIFIYAWDSSRIDREEVKLSLSIRR